jgi:hypothetical protein
VIDGSQTNREAILSYDTVDWLQDRSRRKLKPIWIRQSRYLKNRIEQDHCAIKRQIRPMLGFKSINSARAILGGIEMVRMILKGQAHCARKAHLSLGANEEQQREDLYLKIGIHEGPCLAVTLNDRQDYFGQTVNVAARVQGVADARAICATGSVVDDPQSSRLLKAVGVRPEPHSTVLRGIPDEMTIYEIL